MLFLFGNTCRNLSGGPSPASASARGLTHVATDFVVKPIVPRDFARRVATLLDR